MHIFRGLIAAALIAAFPVLAAAAPKIAVTFSDGSLQPGSTTPFHVSAGKIINANVVNQVSSGTFVFKGSSIAFNAAVTTGTLVDHSTATHTGTHTFSSATITNLTATNFAQTSFSGVIADASTQTHTGGHFFKNGISVSTSAGQPAIFHVGTSSISTNAPTWITGNPGTSNADTNLYGATVSSFVLSGYSPAGGNNQYYDVVSINIPPGKWLVVGYITVNANGATVTDMAMGLGTASGNSAAGLTRANSTQGCLATSAYDCSVALPPHTVAVSSLTTYYLKGYSAHSVATPRAVGAVVAVRLQ